MKIKLIILGLALAVANLANAAYVPVPITTSSYNADVVVEHTVPSLDNNTTATTDGGTNNNGNVWYEIGYNTNAPTSGLPAHGTIFTSASFGDHSYAMAADYTVNNALLIDSGVTNGTLTFTVPTLVSNLSFLVTSGNGGGGIACVIHHLDGSIETNSFNAGDWFNGANPAFVALGRVSATSGGFDTQGSIQNPGNPRLYGREIPVTNTVSPVTSVDFKYASGGANVHNQIYAISGTPPVGGNCVPIAITGYNYDLIIESNAPRTGRLFGTGTNFATTQSMDSDTNSGNSWFERTFVHNFQTNAGIPAQGSSFTNAAGDHVFTFAPDYTANDAIYLNTNNVTATATLVTPTSLSAISILNSTGNGPHSIGVTVNHQSAAAENFTFSSLDWFTGGGTVFMGTSGRVAVDTAALNNFTFPFNPNQAPFIYRNDIILTSLDPVTSISFHYNDTNGRTAIFAIAGSATPVPPIITVNPTDTNVAVGSPWSLSITANAGSATISYQWQKGTNGVFVNINDGGGISGTATATISSTGGVIGDNADYRCIASTSGGPSTSGTATVLVVSPLTAVTKPGDPTAEFAVHSSGQEDQTHAIDGLVGADPAKYLDTGINNGGGNFTGPVGFTVSPSLGPTIITGIRLYTANDTQGRDPIDQELYGSNDGGNTYTLIYSNSVSLPAGRNAAASAPMNPLTQFVRQYLFTNTNSYTSYKWTVTRVLTLSGSLMQIGEVEMLGVQDTNGRPTGSIVGTFARAFSNSVASLTAQVTGNPAPTLRWARGSAGVYTVITNGGRISGATTTNLQVGNVTSADALDYVIIVSNVVGAVTSPPVHLTILSSEVDVTAQFDTINEFGTAYPAGSPNVPSTIPADAIENTGLTYVNVGSGPNAGAGFAPFVGPVGIMVQPGFGPTILGGIRFYTGTGATASDPTDFALDGSRDGGVTFFPLTSGALSLPDTRATGAAINPLKDPMQEFVFANTNICDTYRITWTHVKDAPNATSMQIGEVELLGVAPRPHVTFDTKSSPGNIIITSDSQSSGTVQGSTNLASGVWTNVGSIGPNGSLFIPISPTDPPSFFRVSIP